MIDWLHYFNSPAPSLHAKGAKRGLLDDSTEQNSYAKYAKASEPGPFADLHTNIGHEEPQSLEAVLKGLAVELWSDVSGRLFIVADEEDARSLITNGVRRGEIYTGQEALRVIQIGDPATVAEIHEWKRRFDGVISESDSTRKSPASTSEKERRGDSTSRSRRV